MMVLPRAPEHNCCSGAFGLKIVQLSLSVLTNISKKVKASKTLSRLTILSLTILSLTFQGEKALDPGTHPDQEDTDYRTG